MAGIKKLATTTVFTGQSDIVVFDEVSDYKNATFSTATASGASVGQVSGDSSEYVGEDTEVTNWVDEQGKVITSTATDGTVAVKWEMADLSEDSVVKFLNGVKLSGLTSTLLKNIKSAVGFGVKLPVMTRPIGWFNDEANRCLFLPKAKIVSSITYSDKHFTISSTATAEYIDTTTLKTAMIVEGEPVYENDTEEAA
ncbi:MAG: hypothetical protein K2K45_05230 [Muribaculaceae bacterium]|nr:hypothetical protein [Muribaculaceae bacterium]